MFEIRRINEKDLSQILNIAREQFGNECWTNEQFIEELKLPQGQNFGIFFLEELMCFEFSQQIFDEVNLLYIACKESVKKKGLASQLLKYLQTETKKNNATKIWLEVKENNFVAKNFYLKNGFRQSGIRKKYYKDGQSAILFEKAI